MRHTLKTLALAAGVSLIAVGTGFAADLSNRPVYKAPPAPAPMFSWTGFYIGGHVGYGWGSNDFTDNSAALGRTGTTYSNDTDGFLGGLQAGYDYQFAPNWVLGIEGQVSWSKIDGNTTYVPAFGTTTFSNEAKWLSSVTGRLGYTGGNWLLYAKGGVAWADFDQTIATGVASVTNSQTRTGWTAGGGLEYAFAPGWSAKIEYQYYDFGKESYDFQPIVGVGATPFDVDSNIHTIKAGLNWRFGGLGSHF